MGLVLILAASSSRWPRILRALGAVMCLQAIAANLFGIERARAIMEWEAMQGTALLRAGRRGGLTQRGFCSVCIYKEAVRGAEENSSLETTEHHPLSHRVPPWIDL